MTGLIVKLVVCPLVVYLASLIFSGQVLYLSIYQIVITGIVLAIAGNIMETLMLNKKSVLTSTGMDFIAAAVIVYLSGLIFTGARITLLGALITASLLAIIELGNHFYLISSRKIEST